MTSIEVAHCQPMLRAHLAKGLMGLPCHVPGVSAEVIAAADICAILPMHGMVESFNVSVAAALMLNEARRGRQQVMLPRPQCVLSRAPAHQSGI